MSARVPATFIIAFVLIGLACGCGTPGAPLPPSLDLPKPVEDLRASRQGNRVVLSWTQPKETTDETNIRHPGSTLVCRALNEPKVQSCSAVGQTPAWSPAKEAAPQPVITFNDDLSRDLIGDRTFATYAIEVQNASGRSAGVSNQVPISLAPVSQPQQLRLQRLTADAVVFDSSVLLSRPDATHERIVLRRQEKGTNNIAVAADVSRTFDTGPAGTVAQINLRDESFEWEKTYSYQLSIVATAPLPNGTQVEFESEPTAALDITLHDIFPPAVPRGLQAVFSGTAEAAVDLTWSTNSERDLAGYNVYRREESQAVTQRMKINGELVRTPSFRDSHVARGQRYIYSVTAVDLRNNESAQSEETSELVPP
jgi:hypothetical protein